MATLEDAYDVVFEKEGPLGIDIESSDDGMDAYIRSSSNAKIQKGHMLIAVNDQPLTGLKFEEILDKVKNAKHPRRLSFSSKRREEESKMADSADLPLPADYFCKLPPLKADEDTLVKEFMDSNLKEAMRMATATPESLGLKLLQESQGVTIHVLQKEGGINIVRARTVVPIAADLFMYAALAPDNESFQRIFTMLDPMFRDGHVVHKIPKDWTRYGGKEEVAENVNLPLYSVKWAAYALPFPLWWRDFVFCELTCWTPDGYGVSLAMSHPQISEKIPSMESSHNLVRGSIGMSGYVWRNLPGTDPHKPMGEGSMMTEIIYLLQVDPKGILPPWAVNLTGAQQGMNCLRVVKYAEEQRRLVLKMYEENTELNRTEVMMKDIPKGESFELPFEVNAAGKNIIVDWVLQDNDISFSIIAPNGEKLVSVDKGAFNMGSKPYFGRFKANVKGKHVFKFDNSYSWFTAKKLYYHYLVL
jgi:hypothetical protein